MLILRISGKAWQVFAALALMAEKAGQLTLGEIIRLNAGKEKN